MIPNFAQSAGNNSNQFFHNDFYVVCTCCKFESCTTPSQYSTLWVTWELNSSLSRPAPHWTSHMIGHKNNKIRAQTMPLSLKTMSNIVLECLWNYRFTRGTGLLSSFDIGNKFWKFTRCMNRAEVSLSWMTWSLNSSKSAGENSYLLFYDDFDVSSTFCNFVLYEAQPVFSVMSDMRFSETTGDNSFLVFYDDIYILCTFCTFQPCTTQNKFFPSWVTWEVNFRENCGHNSYLLTYDNFGVLSTFCKFQPGTTQSELSSLRVTG